MYGTSFIIKYMCTDENAIFITDLLSQRMKSGIKRSTILGACLLIYIFFSSDECAMMQISTRLSLNKMIQCLEGNI